MGFHSKRHYQLVSPHKETKSEAAVNGAIRIRMREIGKQANREMAERFMPLTADNAQKAIDWQEERIKQLLKETP